ncbi:MAG: sulfur carrier protein ThiS [Planctomycetota bacterium]|nr:MAG: sulfur carrier protein ThiS [Planctomycetota bacterium]
MALTVNGEPFSIERGATIADLLARLDVRGEAYAVERNLRVVRRAEHASTRLEPGDRIEIVSFVGGG